MPLKELKQKIPPLVNGTAINKRGRPVGSRNKRTIIRDALQESFPTGELGFWQSVSQLAANGDMQAAVMLADRLMPKLKPQSPVVVLTEPLQGTPADMAYQLIQLAGDGELATSQAQELLSALADVMKIVETSELEQRLKKIEQTLLLTDKATL